MYVKYLFIILLFISTNLFGYSTDSLYTEIRGDSLVAYFYDEVNCRFSPLINYSVSDNIISIVAHDTSTEYVTCQVIKSYNIPIINLTSGHYQIKLFFKYNYRFYNPDSLYLINSIEIDYVKSGLQNMHKSNDLNFDLLYCYPNPFNSNLSIKFILSNPSSVQLTIFNNLGQYIYMHNYSFLPVGSYNIYYNFDSFSSGVYLIYLKTDNFIQKQLVTLLK
jgi:hypothetical protein